MAAGCKNPRAVNFNPSANPDNYSCVYMIKHGENCHWFEDIVLEDAVDNSFTMSYSLFGKTWTFFHDYMPDMYIHTREKLFNASDSVLYEHHKNRPGRYHNQTAQHPFFIDVVFQNGFNLILEVVHWITEFLDVEGTDYIGKTLSHISIWNSHQHSGKIDLSTIGEFKNKTARNTKGSWTLKDFRNILLSKNIKFVESLFNDYLLIEETANADQAWYKKELFTDKWFCVRFEFDNSTDNTVILHDTTIQALKSDK